MTEFKHVLMKDNEFFSTETTQSVIVNEGNDDIEAPLLKDDEGRSAESRFAQARRLGYLTGVINSANVVVFERLLWRASRGNMFFRPSPIREPIMDPNNPGKPVAKDVFIVFFQGSRLQSKIKKICESYGAHLYPCPETPQERSELLSKLSTRLEELADVIDKSNQLRLKVLRTILIKWDIWKAKVTKEKAIYHTMNMFNYDIGRRCLIAEGWCPVSSTDQVQEALKTANKVSGSSVPSILNVVRSADEPPTYFKTDKFTESFQNIVDAYGVARYQEVNPTCFSIITFPFLFAVMFGDVGHGFLLTLYAVFLIVKEKQLLQTKLNEMVAMTFAGRYVLILMGIFSIYVGFVYNDCFGVPLNIFSFMGARWGEPPPGTDQYVWLHKSTPYIFGVDPTWKYRKNELNFYNSLKMKISIIFGVAQMTLGIIMSLFNGIHFRKPLNLIFEFIPQMIFLQSIFGYLCFLIITKWLTNWEGPDGKVPFSTPSLLTTLIEMFLKILSPIDADKQFFPGQRYVQILCVILAVTMVPIMLFPKPLLLKRAHRLKMEAQRRQKMEEHAQGTYHHDEEKPEDEGLIEEEEGTEDREEENEEGNGDKKKKKKDKKNSAGVVATKKKDQHGGGHGHNDDEFDFSEVFVHQIIHTIEFVLGCVSNTASYLRLWALSLAHSELAYVFWHQIMLRLMTLDKGVGIGAVGMFAGFAPWAVITFAVLLIMESLSAFLHALRLHWVEFMNKFFAGDGYTFAPFSYVAIARQEEENEESGKK